MKYSKKIKKEAKNMFKKMHIKSENKIASDEYYNMLLENKDKEKLMKDLIHKSKKNSIQNCKQLQNTVSQKMIRDNYFEILLDYFDGLDPDEIRNKLNKMNNKEIKHILIPGDNSRLRSTVSMNIQDIIGHL